MTASATVQPARAPRPVRYAGENPRRGMRANTVRDLAAVFAAHLEEPVHPSDSSSRVHAARREIDLLVEGHGVEIVTETEVAFRLEDPDQRPEAWRETCARCLPEKLQSGAATLVGSGTVGDVLAEIVGSTSQTTQVGAMTTAAAACAAAGPASATGGSERDPTAQALWSR